MDQKELQDRLAAAKARKTAVEGADDLEAEVRQAEREADDAEAIAKAKKEIGADEITTVRTDQGVVILKRVPRPIMQRFMDRDPEKTSSDDIEALVVPHVVHPSPGAFSAMCDRQPLIIGRCGKALAELAGAEKDKQAGKS